MTLPRLTIARRQTCAIFVWLVLCAGLAPARDFTIQTLTDTNRNARTPVIGDSGIVVWQEYAVNQGGGPLAQRPDVVAGDTPGMRSDIYGWQDGQITNLTQADTRIVASERPFISGDTVVFTAYFRDDIPGGFPFVLSIPPKTDAMRQMEADYPGLFDPPLPAPKSALEATLADTNAPEETAVPPSEAPAGNSQTNLQRQMWRHSGKAGDIAVWRPGGSIDRISPGGFHFSMPVISEAGLAFQCARGWPYGYELVIWKPGDTNLTQLTTNYFYVLNADIHGSELVFQAWDGDDYEIMLYHFDTGQLEQITNNQFDDVSPVVWNGQVVWVAHPTVTAEIFLWRDGAIRKISEGTEDNGSPSFWQGRAVWQGYDDTDLEIYYFDGRRTIKLTSNTWDDMAPRIHSGVITWISYVENGDSEIMALDLSDNTPVQLTSNDLEDTGPQTAGEKIVWHTLGSNGAYIQLATPKAPRSVPLN